MYAIFKKEFKSFFRSASGYIILAVFFFIMNGAFYLFNVYAYPTKDISYLFYYILLMLIFISPFITMRTFAEEYKLKTDQLLLTSPVRPIGIVMGKLLGCLAFFGIALLGTLSWLIVIGCYTMPNIGEAVCGYILAILAAAAFFSFGMFISSLTENQIVSAICSFLGYIGFFIIYFVALMGVFYTVTSQISPFSHFTSFNSGILSLKDIAYYICFSAVFIILTAKRLSKRSH